MHNITYQRYGKSLSVGLCEISSIDLTTSYAPGDNIDLLRFLHATAGAGHHQKGVGVQEYYKVQELYKVRERYKCSTSDVTTPDSLTQPSSTLPSFAMKALPLPTAHEGSIHLSYNSANSSTFQVTTARDAYGQVVISYQRYEYNNDLSEGLPVINNTTNLSEGLLVINDMTDLSEWLSVINNTINLSEGLPVINNTSAKMTCVIAGLCGL